MMVTMTILPIAEVKRRLSELVTRVSRRHERVALTRNSRPVAVLISPDDLEGLEIAAEVLADPEAMDRNREAKDAVGRDGRGCHYPGRSGRAAVPAREPSACRVEGAPPAAGRLPAGGPRRSPPRPPSSALARWLTIAGGPASRFTGSCPTATARAVATTVSSTASTAPATSSQSWTSPPEATSAGHASPPASSRTCPQTAASLHMPPMRRRVRLWPVVAGRG